MVRSRVAVVMALLAAELLIVVVINPLGIMDKSCSLGLKFPAASNAAEKLVEMGFNRSSLQHCRRGLIFVYDLPEEFNVELLRRCHNLYPWKSMCSALSNSGLGPRVFASSSSSSSRWGIFHWSLFSIRNSDEISWPALESWHVTYQFSGEIIFHHRMLRHPCRTPDPARATAFFVPFYAGLDISRNLWTTGRKAHDLDLLGEQLLHWLQLRHPHFNRSGGADHFMAPGRTSWDFRRLPTADPSAEWGSSLFHRAQMARIKRLVVERNPWDVSEIGVPYPTSFHPVSDDDLVQWMEFVRGRPRTHLVAFAGSPRPGYRAAVVDFRQVLLDQCRAAPHGMAGCLDCTAESSGCISDPLRVSKLFLGSVFCLQPRGDSFTRKSLFDSLIAGCIPVLFWNQTAYWQYQLYLPAEADEYSVFIPHQDVRNGTNVVDVLREISRERIESMQRAVLQLIPRLLYSSPVSVPERRHWADAIDVAVDGVMDRIREEVRV